MSELISVEKLTNIVKKNKMKQYINCNNYKTKYFNKIDNYVNIKNLNSFDLIIHNIFSELLKKRYFYKSDCDKIFINKNYNIINQIIKNNVLHYKINNYNYDELNEKDLFILPFVYDYNNESIENFSNLINYLYETYHNIFTFIYNYLIIYINNNEFKNYIINYKQPTLYSLKFLIEYYNFPKIDFKDNITEYNHNAKDFSYMQLGALGSDILNNNCCEINYYEKCKIPFTSNKILDLNINYLSFTVDALPSGFLDKVKPLKKLFEKIYFSLIYYNYEKKYICKAIVDNYFTYHNPFKNIDNNDKINKEEDENDEDND